MVEKFRCLLETPAPTPVGLGGTGAVAHLHYETASGSAPLWTSLKDQLPLSQHNYSPPLLQQLAVPLRAAAYLSTKDAEIHSVYSSLLFLKCGGRFLFGV